MDGASGKPLHPMVWAGRVEMANWLLAPSRDPRRIDRRRLASCGYQDGNEVLRYMEQHSIHVWFREHEKGQ
jgi:hypothetical protein